MHIAHSLLESSEEIVVSAVTSEEVMCISMPIEKRLVNLMCTFPYLHHLILGFLADPPCPRFVSLV